MIDIKTCRKCEFFCDPYCECVEANCMVELADRDWVFGVKFVVPEKCPFGLEQLMYEEKRD